MIIIPKVLIRYIIIKRNNYFTENYNLKSLEHNHLSI